MTELPVLGFHYHGNVTERQGQQILYTLEECYRRLSAHLLPEKVEVRLCETPSQLTDILQAEKADLGIDTLGDEAFICSHDAWRGFPRILICIERLRALSTEAQQGAVRHEAAHTVLHGGLVYYVLRIPPDCIELARSRGVHLTLLQQVLYYCATAVKDFEVTRLLLRVGYHDCQVSFAKAQFSPSEEDRLAWYLARYNSQARLLFFTAQLKTLLVGWPLEVSGLLQLSSCTDSMLNYVEADERRRLLSLAGSIAEQLGDDTHDNMRLALRQVLQELL